MELMRSQEVVVRHPQSKIVAGTVITVETVGGTVGCLVGAIKALDHLLVRTEFLGNGIIVCKTDDLCYLKLKLLAELHEELLCGKDVGTVPVRDEPEVFWKFRHVLKGHAHCHDAGTDGSVVGNLITYDGPGCGVYDKPNVPLDATDFDVGFIGGECGAFLVRLGIHERLDADGCSLAVVCHHLIGHGDAVEVFRGL